MADACWHKKGQLPEDLTELTVAVCDRIPQAQLKAIESEMLKSKTGLFDSHPTHGERIESDQREQAPGVYHIEEPATQLFKGFSKSTREVTLWFYLEVIGTGLEKEHDLNRVSTRRGEVALRNIAIRYSLRRRDDRKLPFDASQVPLSVFH